MADNKNVNLYINTKGASASIKELTNDVGKLRNQIALLDPTTKEFTEQSKELEKVKSRLNEIKNKTSEVNNVLDNSNSRLSSIKAAFLGAFSVTAAIELGKSIWNMGKEVIATTANFQKMFALLENGLGSEAEARQTFDMITEFSAKTPYQVDQVTESYIKFVNRGLKPTKEELTAFGDFASSQGKGLDQLTEAIMDVSNPERWKEFGVQVHKANGMVSLSFKNQTITVKDNIEAVSGAIKQFGEMKGVVGTMASVSKTLDGQLSNLEDSITSLEAELGGKLAGSASDYISTLQEITEYSKELVRESEPVSDVFSSVGESAGRLFSSISSLVSVFIPFVSRADSAATIMKLLGTAINAAFTPLRLFIATINTSVDALRILLNTGKEVANFFGADFKLDPKANFETLKNNAKKNFGEIAQSYVDIWTDDTTKKAVEDISKLNVEEHKKANEEIEQENKKADDKKQKEAEALAKKIHQLEIDALGDTLDEKIHKLRLQAQAEIELLKGTEEQKRQQRLLILKKMNNEVDKLLRDQNEKELKEAERLQKEKDDLYQEAIRKYNEKEKAAAFATNDLKLIMAKGNEDAILKAKLERLELEKKYELQNTELTEQEKDAIKAKYEADSNELIAQKREADRQEKIANTQEDLEMAAFAIDTISQFNSLRSDKELQENEEQKNARIAHLDQELAAKRITQEQYDKARMSAEANADKNERALKRKKAEQDKLAAIAQATITAALGVLRASAALPPPFNLPGIIQASIIGATQIALIAATPIPKFAEGGSTKRAMRYRTDLPTVHHGGFIDQPLIAEFGEEGPEYVVPNWMLNDPIVGNMVGMMETMRQGRPKQAFAEGGPTIGEVAVNANQPAPDASYVAMIQEIRALRADIKNWNTNLEAHIVWRKIKEASDTVAAIESESKLS